MSQNPSFDPAWQVHCEALRIDPATRWQARLQLLADPACLNASVYRPDEDDEDAEEFDLGDAWLVIDGPFQAPADWDAVMRDDYFDGADPADFFAARFEPGATPGQRGHFQARPGDLLAVTEASGRIQMYYLYEVEEAEDSTRLVLIREESDF